MWTTGIARLGLSAADVQSLADNADHFEAFSCTLVMSHLVSADVPGHPMKPRTGSSVRCASRASASGARQSRQFRGNPQRSGLPLRYGPYGYRTVRRQSGPVQSEPGAARWRRSPLRCSRCETSKKVARSATAVLGRHRGLPGLPLFPSVTPMGTSGGCREPTRRTARLSGSRTSRPHWRGEFLWT